MENYASPSLDDKLGLADYLSSLTGPRSELAQAGSDSQRILVLQLRGHDRKLNYQFFQEYARFIKHPSTPQLPIADVIVLYDKWSRNPDIISHLLMFADKLSKATALIVVWRNVIKWMPNQTEQNNTLGSIEYLCHLLKPTFLKAENAPFLETLVYGAFHHGFARKPLSKAHKSTHSAFRKSAKLPVQLLDKAYKEYKENGEITMRDFTQFCERLTHLNDYWPKHHPRFEEFTKFLFTHFSARHVLNFFFRKNECRHISDRYNETLFNIWLERPEKFKPVSFQSWHAKKGLEPIAYYVFTHALGSFVIPEPFRYGLDVMSPVEHQWLLDVLKGRKIGDLENLPFRPTNKSVAIFNMLFSEHPSFAKDTRGNQNTINNYQGITYYLLASELMYWEATPEDILNINMNNILHGDIALQTWIDHLKIIFKLKLTAFQMNEVVDYIHYLHVLEGETANLKGVTVSSLMQRLEQFRFRQRLQAYVKQYEGMDFFISDIPDFKMESNQVVYTIRQIRNAKRLIQESEHMKHCVATYIRHCISGNAHIYSMMSVTEQVESHLVTLELNKSNKLIQARGLLNRPVNAEELFVIDQWIKKNKLSRVESL
jgi:hypothetical protein